jgi:hypothetical protein
MPSKWAVEEDIGRQSFIGQTRGKLEEPYYSCWGVDRRAD